MDPDNRIRDRHLSQSLATKRSLHDGQIPVVRRRCLRTTQNRLRFLTRPKRGEAGREVVCHPVFCLSNETHSDLRIRSTEYCP